MANMFTNWLAGAPGPGLSAESMTKVSIITDINKAVKLVNGKDICPREFDYLYDMPLDKLQEHDNQMKLKAEADVRFNDYMRRASNGDCD